jgi:hypothetical protein
VAYVRGPEDHVQDLAPSGSGDGAANCECVAHIRVEVGVFRIRLDPQRVQGLAEKALRGSRKNDISVISSSDSPNDRSRSISPC